MTPLSHFSGSMQYQPGQRETIFGKKEKEQETDEQEEEEQEEDNLLQSEQK